MKITVLEFDKEMILHRMALVCGTSTCHMAVSRDKLFIPGVWGPFWSGMVEINSNIFFIKFFILNSGSMRRNGAGGLRSKWDNQNACIIKIYVDMFCANYY